MPLKIVEGGDKMRVKKIGAILAGAVMIGSAVAAAWYPVEIAIRAIEVAIEAGAV